MSEITQEQKSSTKNQPLEGYVAGILNEREVIINLGTQQGVTEGMKFAILDNEEIAVKDPITNENLGVLPPRPKIRVQVVEVQEKLCIARTYQTRVVNRGGEGNALFAIGGIFDTRPPDYVEEPYTFKVDKNDFTFYKKIDPEDSIVSRGDKVVQITRSKDF